MLCFFRRILFLSKRRLGYFFILLCCCCCRMKCLLCSLHFIRESALKKHYVDYHFISDQDIFFKELFLPDTIEKMCRICRETFKSSRSKKNHMFLFHYGKHQQLGGNRDPRNSTLPINVLKRGPTTYYSINFNQHKNFYDFFSSQRNV